MSTKSARIAESETGATRKAQAAAVSDDRIRGHAYEIFEARGNNGEIGDSLSDWLLAERNLRASAQSQCSDHVLPSPRAPGVLG